MTLECHIKLMCLAHNYSHFAQSLTLIILRDSPYVKIELNIKYPCKNLKLTLKLHLKHMCLAHSYSHFSSCYIYYIWRLIMDPKHLNEDEISAEIVLTTQNDSWALSRAHTPCSLLLTLHSKWEQFSFGRLKVSANIINTKIKYSNSWSSYKAYVSCSQLLTFCSVFKFDYFIRSTISKKD